jgi:hypothetical protein
VISDTLLDAAAEIRDYLREFPDYDYQSDIKHLLKLMDSVALQFARPPAINRQYVSEDAVIRRINRRLAEVGEWIGKWSGPYTRCQYYYRDANSVIGEFDDLEDFARAHDALASHESVA